MDKKLASLLAFRSQSLKIHAQHRIAEIEQLKKQSGDETLIFLHARLHPFFSRTSFLCGLRNACRFLIGIPSFAADLVTQRKDLDDEAKKEGQEADAIVTTAGNLLESAKQMSLRAANSAEAEEVGSEESNFQCR